MTFDEWLDASDIITWFDFFHCRASAISINTTLKQKSSLNNSRSTTIRQHDYDGAVSNWPHRNWLSTARPPRPTQGLHRPACCASNINATCHLSHGQNKGQYQCNLLQRAAVPPTIATPKAHLHVCIPLSQLAEVQQHGIPQNYDCKFTKCLYKALQIQPCVFTSQSSSRTIKS